MTQRNLDDSPFSRAAIGTDLVRRRVPIAGAIPTEGHKSTLDMWCRRDTRAVDIGG